MAKAREVEGLDPEAPFALAAARAVAVRAQELFEHSADVLDIDDIERVHDMRVATRRLRAVLEIFAPCFPKDEHRPVLRDVKRLADALGFRRDPDVQLEALDGLAGAMRKVEAPGVEAFAARLRADQEAGNQTLAAVLEEVHAGALADRLRALVASAERLAHEAEIDEEEPEVAATVPSADGAGDQSAARVGGEPGAGAPEEAAA